MSTERIVLNEAYRLLADALTLMDVPEQFQDEEWMMRRQKIQDAVLAFEQNQQLMQQSVSMPPPARDPHAHTN